MKINKFNYVKILQSNCGYGWDDVLEFENESGVKDRKSMLKCYRENEPKSLHRIIERRILRNK